MIVFITGAGITALENVYLAVARLQTNQSVRVFTQDTDTQHEKVGTTNVVNLNDSQGDLPLKVYRDLTKAVATADQVIVVGTNPKFSQIYEPVIARHALGKITYLLDTNRDHWLRDSVTNHVTDTKLFKDWIDGFGIEMRTL